MAFHCLRRTHHQPCRSLHCVFTVCSPLQQGRLADQYRWPNPGKLLGPMLRLGLVGLVLANLFVTGVSTFLSVHNYPGGEVWKVLDDLLRDSNDTGKLQGPLCYSRRSDDPLQPISSTNRRDALYVFTFIFHSFRSLPGTTASNGAVLDLL